MCTVAAVSFETHGWEGQKIIRIKMNDPGCNVFGDKKDKMITSKR